MLDAIFVSLPLALKIVEEIYNNVASINWSYWAAGSYWTNGTAWSSRINWSYWAAGSYWTGRT
jgi:hypothetical protein